MDGEIQSGRVHSAQIHDNLQRHLLPDGVATDEISGTSSLKDGQFLLTNIKTGLANSAKEAEKKRPSASF